MSLILKKYRWGPRITHKKERKKYGKSRKVVVYGRVLHFINNEKDNSLFKRKRKL